MSNEIPTELSVLQEISAKLDKLVDLETKLNELKAELGKLGSLDTQLAELVSIKNLINRRVR